MSELYGRMSEDKLKRAREIVADSRYLVCLKGRIISGLCGCSNYQNPQEAYEVEAKYGYSPEEMLSAGFYNTRVDQFYEFYKKEILAGLGTVPEGLRALARMEQRGILKSIITRDIYSLAKRAGCQKVLELHGSVYHNHCPHCKEAYSIEYIQTAKGVPKCEKCGTTIRPQVQLRGEMVDNKLVTQAADEMIRADVLLLIGCRMNAYLSEMLLRYYKGDKIILINPNKHFKDYLADMALYGNPMEILEQLEV